MNKNYLFSSSAVKVVLQELEAKGYRHDAPIAINCGGYHIIKGTPNIAITFKKDWFYNFATVCKGEEGIGDSINVADIKIMINAEVEDIYIMYKTGALYHITMHDFLLYSFSWKNKEGKVVRSISIHRYKRVN